MNAKTNNHCCAWFQSRHMGPNNKNKKKNVLKKGDTYCGSPWNGAKSFKAEKEQCCDAAFDKIDDCDASAWPKGYGFNAVLRFARDEKAWLKNIVRVWAHAVSRNSYTANYRLAKDKGSRPDLKIDWSKHQLNHRK